MSRRLAYLRATKNEEAGTNCAAWAPRSKGVTDAPFSFVLFGRGDGNEQAVALAEYDFDKDALSDTIHAMATEDGRPLRLAVHPSGDGVMCAFADSCKFFEMDSKSKKLKAFERELPLLQGIGLQNCICFSGDGSLFASGGKDGHLRVFIWPSCQLVLDEPCAQRSIQDLDISMDSAYIATTAEDGACRVWEVAKRESIAQLPRDKGEKFGYCRFSRNGTQAFLFVTYTKGKKGCVGVWNMEDWSKVGYKRLADAPIASVAVSRDGKFLGLGTTEGDVAVVMIKKMEVMQLIGSVHNAPVTGLEFSKHGRAILSVGGDATAHINRLKKSEWKEWQLYSLLLAMIVVSGLLFWAFFESSLSDQFWQFPMGRQQPARPPPEAIYGWPVGNQEPEATGL